MIYSLSMLFRVNAYKLLKIVIKKLRLIKTQSYLVQKFCEGSMFKVKIKNYF